MAKSGFVKATTKPQEGVAVIMTFLLLLFLFIFFTETETLNYIQKQGPLMAERKVEKEHEHPPSF
jgi:hypothetical protein